ncbi:Transducin/WD40 repeat-like superfamily protein isoform 2 [Hibiscus syriacus]|uniref:Transducin/WD40 repeat-like superfamily protein isoform 2 n=1 Tax=Hibiscus syriacus TaxID=106335 RepID=A0A6A3BH00_HIBSY|nr:Transducin/WD40 repeat-like superfamily protein isoform 2 [Hibiscus syriacus]
MNCVWGDLRNLLWATSKRDVYLMKNYSVMHWSSLLHRGEEVLNVAEPIFSSLYLNQPGVAFYTKLTTDDNAITNAVDVYRNPSGAMRVTAANNDAQIIIYDAETFASVNRYSFDWSVNNTSASPDGKLLAVLGDSVECLIVDAQPRKVTSSLKGHLDYSFASDWRMGAIRGAKFTSDGQFLAMAEPADFVHVFNAKSGLSEFICKRDNHYLDSMLQTG